MSKIKASQLHDKSNDFFINIGPNLEAKIPEQSLSPLMYLRTLSPNDGVFPTELKLDWCDSFVSIQW